ncbi:MAG: N-acetyltransferase [Leptolyngbyaceae cyanobacterium MO_188.B28]|nr:N-acetyltransferase [Leptolyngbyaceae cyanobacterium MO_188.B28]
MHIRLSNTNDLEAICAIHHSAFGEEERESIVELVINFLSQPSDYDTLSFVAEEDGIVIGHTIFSEIKFIEHNTKAFILAPLAVLPSHQNRGIGTSLVKHGLNYLSSQGTEFVFVYGDPKYYSRFGFHTENSKNFVPPYTLQYLHGWQYLQFNKSSFPATPIHLSCAPPLRKPELW